MTGSCISRATSSLAYNARIPRLPVRYAVILRPESMVNFRCIEADVAMQQNIPFLQHAIYHFTKPLPAKQARSLDVETIDTPWHTVSTGHHLMTGTLQFRKRLRYPQSSFRYFYQASWWA